MQRTVLYLLATAALWLAECGSASQANAPGGQVVTAVEPAPGATAPHLAEPFIFSDRKKYYLVGTVSSTEGFQCYESADLVSWKLDGWAWRVSGMRVARGGFRAPRVFSYQGLYYLVYGARFAGGNKFGLAASTQPQGPYHDVHVPWLSLGDGCTGANVFVDRNGKGFLTFCRSGSIYGASLNKDLSSLSAQPVSLLQPEQRWELKESSPGMDSICMFRIGSKYYLTYSAGGPHTPKAAIGYATADKPLGPWTKSEENPLLSTQAEPGISSPTQGSVFRSLDGKEWLITYQTTQTAPTGSVASINIENLELMGIRQLVLKPASRRVLLLN
jgi:beta-xylosidase